MKYTVNYYIKGAFKETVFSTVNGTINDIDQLTELINKVLKIDGTCFLDLGNECKYVFMKKDRKIDTWITKSTNVESIHKTIPSKNILIDYLALILTKPAEFVPVALNAYNIKVDNYLSINDLEG